MPQVAGRASPPRATRFFIVDTNEKVVIYCITRGQRMKLLTEALQIRVSKSMFRKLDEHAISRKATMSTLIRAMLWMAILWPNGLDKTIAMLDDLELGVHECLKH